MHRNRVLIVDDSALVRQHAHGDSRQRPGDRGRRHGEDAYVAREKIKVLNPDVLTLDVEMPKMDGITFLRNLMRLRPMPVVMVSSLTEHGADVTLDALALGAVDYLAKPKIDVAATLQEYGDELIAKIKAAARRACGRCVDAGRLPTRRGGAPRAERRRGLPQSRPARPFRTTDRIIAIGASTGGTEAIKEVLMGCRRTRPGVVIAQHIPKAFSGPFAQRMDACCHLTVYEAEDGQQVLAGHVYIAPGDQHLLLVRDGARYLCRLDDGPPVTATSLRSMCCSARWRSSAGRNAIGVILTGMGKDGAAGLKEMRDAGSRTIAQDEATSVVWGMPGEAVALGAVVQVLPLDAISARIGVLAQSMDITQVATTAATGARELSHDD